MNPTTGLSRLPLTAFPTTTFPTATFPTTAFPATDDATNGVISDHAVPDQRTEQRPAPQAHRAPDWTTRPHPVTDIDWLTRADEVSALLATDAAARDRAGLTPYTEVTLLKDSGLVTLLGPARHGGGGQEWPTAYHVVREIAAADGSLGQLLGYHYLWSWAARLVGTPEQIETVEAEAARERWFFGGPLDSRDEDLTIRDDGAQVVFNGHKSFSAGSKVSDVTVLEGVLDDPTGNPTGVATRLFAIVPTRQPGITWHDDRDDLGRRLTESGGVSGGVSVAEVRVHWEDALGFRDKEFQPRVYNTLNVPTIQLVLANLYLGIARGALRTAAEYTRTHARPWLHGERQRAVEEPHQLDLYGDLTAKLWAVEALADQVAEEGLAIHRHLWSVTEQERGEHEVRVAAVKARATEVALEVTSRVLEGTGDHPTTTELGLDRFWRNIRTHTVQDPVAYRRREVGAYLLRDELPEPSWYS